MTDYAPFDAAEHLKTDQDIATYLEAVLAEVEATDDVSYFAHALGVVARTRNMSQLARDARMSREGLYKALSSDGNPSFASILKITRSLGLRLTFEPA
ncbi:addiction module antidote protein [uncultured Brevundimonas sp.]|uniref:addiction module antidote protein n=1 Tax=uncultured Brevundimonas sp. TaxID=213418 RepID=UPI0026027A93|nr:addiction module antidote protein [uncultured Brevundimonas sp.]